MESWCKKKVRRAIGMVQIHQVLLTSSRKFANQGSSTWGILNKRCRTFLAHLWPLEKGVKQPDIFYFHTGVPTLLYPVAALVNFNAAKYMFKSCNNGQTTTNVRRNCQNTPVCEAKSEHKALNKSLVGTAYILHMPAFADKCTYVQNML